MHHHSTSIRLPSRQLGFLAGILAFFVAPESSAAQPASAPPQVVVTAVGEIRVTPDRAHLSLGVQSRASTAAAAAADNARRQRAVIDTLRAIGFRPEQISTMSYQVHPEMRYDERGRVPEVIGYVVSNVVRVDIHQVDRVGTAIDASLAKGANQIHGLDFYVSNPDEARRQALADAMRRARGDAEAIAAAGGARLGQLLEVSTAGGGGPIIVRGGMEMARMDAAGAVPTPIEPGQENLRVTIVARWQLLQ
jgi:uncharacterized protein